MVRMDTRNLFSAALVTLTVAAAVFVSPPPARAQATADGNTPYVAVITEDEVYIRAGNAEGHYPIGKAKRGEFVRVTDEKYEWAQIQTIGPVFERFHGLVKYPEKITDRLRVAPDGKSALTLGRVEVIAPNPNVRPVESWKMIARLGPNETIRILETGRTERGEIIHTIVLPDSARVWIKKKFLRRATESEVAQWTRILGGETPVPETTQAKRPETPRAVGSELKANAQPADRVLPRDSTPVPPVAGNEAPAASTPEVSTNQPAEIVMQPAAQPKDTPVAVRRGPKKSVAQVKFNELEELYARLQDEPIESAEINPLRHLYIDLSDEFADNKTVNRYAKARAEQLQIWGELQQRRAEMQKIEARLKLTSNDAEAIREAMESGKKYNAIGRLGASVIFDGVKMPRLLRLQDPGTGRTIAYLQPEDDQFEIGSMVGQLIGIVGDTAYDGGLRLSLITPQRIDLLSPSP